MMRDIRSGGSLRAMVTISLRFRVVIFSCSFLEVSLTVLNTLTLFYLHIYTHIHTQAHISVLLHTQHITLLSHTNCQELASDKNTQEHPRTPTTRQTSHGREKRSRDSRASSRQLPHGGGQALEEDPKGAQGCPHQGGTCNFIFSKHHFP